MRVIVLCVLLGLVALIAGCHGKTFSVSDGQSRLVQAEHRAILSVKRPVIGVEGQPVLDDGNRHVTSVAVCAEPSPDALQSTALALAGEASADKIDAILGASFAQSTSQEYIGLRTQTIQLLRDAHFRLCEGFMNDGIDAIAYDVLQRRFQSQIVALLAVEQLTGAVVARRQEAGGDPATQLARIARELEKAENKLQDLMSKHKKEVSDAFKARIEKQIDRQRKVIELLAASYEKAVQRTATHEVSEPEGISSDAGQSEAVSVAEAVRAITLNAINQDYESQVCFETLRFHNHLGQFRNDVNNAFDSGGIPTNLEESAFLTHCRNLFASQFDFRNARVSAAEALADAIKTVTKKIGANNFSAKDAATYIRALADSVPTEPGVAFLPRVPVDNSNLGLRVGGNVKVWGDLKVDTDNIAGSPGSGQQERPNKRNGSR